MTHAPASDLPPAAWPDPDLPPVRDPAGTEEQAPNPLSALARLMRDRWRWSFLAGGALAPICAVLGYVSAAPLFGAQAILRVYPQEANILYATGDDSVLKTFDSFVKAETSYVASYPVMERARQTLLRSHPDLTAGMTLQDLTGSVEIKRNDSLIVLTTLSRDADFAAAKLDAVVDAYLSRKKEDEAKRAEVRLSELQGRESALSARLAEIRAAKLAVGGEFGIDAITKAHFEKVAQIEALQVRRADVAATLAQLEADSGTTNADMSNQEILRATLLDRALADLNFDRAKREAELSSLKSRYPANHRAVQDLIGEIDVIDRAMAERREQIKVLGQTGALTDQSAASAEATSDEIRALYNKLTEQLATVRAEARDLNAKRIELSNLTEDETETRALLDETRKALEVIRLEAGRALPGYTVLMSPPSVASGPAQDTRKMLAVAGIGAGIAIGLAGGLIAGITNRKLRFSDDLPQGAVALLHVSPDQPADALAEVDRIRNALQLHPLRGPRLVGKGRLIALARPDTGPGDDLVIALAQSFARARLSTLLVDADLSAATLTPRLGESDHPGWRQVLLGDTPQPCTLPDHPGLMFLPQGTALGTDDQNAALPTLRLALSRLADLADVVLVNAGSLSQNPSAELILAACDLALAEVRAGDDRRTVLARLDRLDSLPRHGGAMVFTHARRSDPGLAA